MGGKEAEQGISRTVPQRAAGSRGSGDMEVSPPGRELEYRSTAPSTSEYVKVKNVSEEGCPAAWGQPSTSTGVSSLSDQSGQPAGTQVLGPGRTPMSAAGRGAKSPEEHGGHPHKRQREGLRWDV